MSLINFTISQGVKLRSSELVVIAVFVLRAECPLLSTSKPLNSTPSSLAKRDDSDRYANVYIRALMCAMSEISVYKLSGHSYEGSLMLMIYLRIYGLKYGGFAYYASNVRCV